MLASIHLWYPEANCGRLTYLVTCETYLYPATVLGNDCTITIHFYKVSPKVKTYGQSALSFRAPISWNSLPEDIRIKYLKNNL